MYFKQAFKGKNDWWRYLVVALLVFIGYNIGGIPLELARLKLQDQNSELGSPDLSTFTQNFEQFGINTNLGLTLLLLFFVAAITVFYFTFSPFHRREFKTLSTASTRIRYKRVFFAFFLWLALSLTVEAFSYILTPDQFSWNYNPATFIPLVLICLFVLPIQTSFEELFFRGYLMQGIGTARWRNVIIVTLSLLFTLGIAKLSSVWRGNIVASVDNENLAATLGLVSNLFLVFIFLGICKLGVNYVKSAEPSSFGVRSYKWVPLVVTSLLFALVHGSNPEIENFGTGIMMTYYISAGLLLGVITIMDDGLELALGTHAATNFTGAVFVGYDGAAITTDSLLVTHNLNPYLMTLAFYVMAILFLLILRYRYQWTTFKKLLDPITKPNEDSQLDKHLSKHLVNN